MAKIYSFSINRLSWPIVTRQFVDFAKISAGRKNSRTYRSKYSRLEAQYECRHFGRMGVYWLDSLAILNSRRHFIIFLKAAGFDAKFDSSVIFSMIMKIKVYIKQLSDLLFLSRTLLL